jgi:hypothetical protein
MLDDQKVFDDVDRLAQQLQQSWDKAKPRRNLSISKDLLTLAKAVQALRSSSDQSPSPSLEHSQDEQDEDRQSSIGEEYEGVLYPHKSSSSPTRGSEMTPLPPTVTDRCSRLVSGREWDLIQRIRRVQQQWDKSPNEINALTLLGNVLNHLARHIE